MSQPHVRGPIDFLVIEYPPGATGTATARELFDLVESDTVRLYDLVVVEKGPDGSCAEIDLSETSPGRLHDVRALAGARSGLVGTDDLEELAGVIDPGAVAIVVMYENRWAVPFVAAARSEGAGVVAGARLTGQEIMDALDAVEAAS